MPHPLSRVYNKIIKCSMFKVLHLLNILEFAIEGFDNGSFSEK